MTKGEPDFSGINTSKLNVNLSKDDLLKKFPDTELKRDSSNEIIIISYIESAKILSHKLSEYEKAVSIYYYLMSRFENSPYMEIVYDELIKCLRILDRNAELNQTESLLNSKFSDGKILSGRKKYAIFEAKQKENLKTLLQLDETLEKGYIQNVFDQLVSMQKELDTGKSAIHFNVLLAKAAIQLNNDSIAITTLDKIYEKTKDVATKKSIDRIIERFERRPEIIEYLQFKEVKRANADSFVEVRLDTVRMHIQELIDSLNARERRPKPPEPEPLKDSAQFRDSFYIVCVFNKLMEKNFIKESITWLNKYNKFDYPKLNLKIEVLTPQGVQNAVIGIFTDTLSVLKYYNSILIKAPKGITWIKNLQLYNFYIVEKEKLNFIEKEGMLKKNSNFILLKFADLINKSKSK